MTQPIHIFQAGHRTPRVGPAIDFSESDLAASAAAYDPAVHEAPLVIGHPKINAPAYGWVSKLSARGADLMAEPTQVDPEFAEMVSAGRFKKVSASWYLPDSPANPKPGVYYLRHVGFLGAHAPGVKGLRQVEFAEDETGTVTIDFADPDDLMVVRLFRGLRDFIISKFGTDAADQVLPGDALDALQTSASTEPDDDDASPAFSESTQPRKPQKEDSSMSAQNPSAQAAKASDADFAERQTALDAREQELKDREARMEQQESERRKQDAADFAESLVVDGRILPRHKDGLVAVLGTVNPEQVIEFGEGDGSFKGDAGTWLRSFLGELPKQIEFGEVSGADDDAVATADFSAPSGYHVDQGSLALHNKALAYQQKHNVDYVTAVTAVGG